MNKNQEHSMVKPGLFTGYSDTYIKLTKSRSIFLSEDVTKESAAQLSAL